MSGIRIKAAMSGDAAVIKCLMQHPMETGFRKDAKTGQLIPAHFIDHVMATVAGKTVLDAQWGGGIASNPFLEFRVKGAKAGDKVTISWQDNKGEKDSADATIA
jgi:sulfur-oxidizing protein SoxZ